MTSKPFSILLVDDHILFRQGLKFLLEDLDENIQFIEANDCDSALKMDHFDGIDLVLLDYHLPGGTSGKAAIEEIKKVYVDSSVVVLSSEDDVEIIRSAIDRGAVGFIPKSSTPEIMIAALKLVLAGGVYLPTIAASTSPSVRESEAKQQESSEYQFGEYSKQLSGRQRQVLKSALKGNPNKIIARELDIAEGTVKAHLSVAFKIMGVKNRTEAVFMAAQQGWTI